MSGSREKREERGEVLLRGVSVSSGVAVGEVFIMGEEEPPVEDREIAPEEIPAEEERFRRALDRTRDEIRKIRTRYRSVIGEELVRIFDAQLMILQDETMLEGTFRRIREERRNASAAFQAILSEAIVNLSRIENEYLRDRVEDLKDVRRRVLHNLAGRGSRSIAHIQKGVIVVAEDLTPSQTVQLPRSKVKGMATLGGGRTSHTAIMARSLQIPAVVGVEGLLREVRNKERVIVDASEGIVVVRPGPERLKQALSRQRRYREISRERLRLRDLPSVTRDGVTIDLFANVDVPEEVPLAVEHRAKGIGLFRTEFLYLRDADMAREEVQTSIYRKILRRLSPGEVVLRTLDVGGDKVFDPLGGVLEQNPMLGWRGIRVSLELKDLFRSQIRALLRASKTGNLSILLPMISTLEEVREAKRIIAETGEELRIEGHDVTGPYRLGVMIETPAAVHLAPHLAKEADFFSIGTNDLIQYGLAVDRDNIKVAYLFDPFHPAISAMVRRVIDVGREAGIPVSICGEMAGEPLGAVLLVGLGARILSVHPYLIPDLKRIFCLLDTKEAKELADRVIDLPSAAEAREAVESYVHELELRSQETTRCEGG
ncbi:MAG: phosphoenolpyruvate--protein phosphotransferase [Candidatus Eisenbacteria bacterium]|nr:phosphoenolpyruvate--protein phosphotransferase [Candidatus Eisenbacteria bacterium]